ncbi:hypothetical protein [Lacipirellula limnantheis]|uniref:Planctomycete cytochrome C n=1 Tax=Lacipirellula limnantheis TaxID=2528024 RepID=A0A517TTM6_9BACT|nr:hypothetical protein [Lacipirellula limnantheis]QDT71731.1 hypothetical protein I41_08910 [Lacipirellula limnantheis]
MPHVTRPLFLIAVMCCAISTLPPLRCSADESTADAELRESATTVLKKYCYKCHLGSASDAGGYTFDVTRLSSLIDEGVVEPGNSEESMIVDVVLGDEPSMPKGKGPRPTAEEYDAVVKWINAGAPVEATVARSPVTDRDTLQLILDDLRRLDPELRERVRYFSLATSHNNVQDVEAKLLPQFRAAFVKALNSLSWEKELVSMKPIDPQETLFRVDLRSVGWNRDHHWSSILAAYPYAITRDEANDPPSAELELAILRESPHALPYLRVDWFVATATRSPLYETILQLPATTTELEQRLGVERTKNLQENNVVRAGMRESNVARENRLVERHPTRYGAYWVSYDFRSSDGRGNLASFPLGPRYADNKFDEQAFEYDGGEIIFNLPNGLQAYYLADSKGNRLLDPAPNDIVTDPARASGTTDVVNGISCIVCHADGMKPARDVIRNGSALGGDPLKKVKLLYPPQEVVDQWLRDDSKRHLDAVREAVGPDELGDPGEPVAAMAYEYYQSLTLQRAAIEVGVSPERLSEAIRLDRSLQRMGLKPLIEQGKKPGKILRSAWQSREFAVSPMQQASQVLGVGSPLNVSGPADR